MRSCLVEVGHIRIEHALELLLLKDQQVVEAFLPHTPHEAFTDGIGAWRMIGGFENLDATCPRHPSKARSEFAIVITDQIFRHLPIGSRFPELLGNQASVGEGVTPTWITLRDCTSIRKKAKSGRKKRSVTWRKSQDQTCAAWLRRKVAHV